MSFQSNVSRTWDNKGDLRMPKFARRIERKFNNAIRVPLTARLVWGRRTPVHILHIPKTGGTAIRESLNPDRIGRKETSSHVIFFRNHEVHLDHVPNGHKIVFGLRDPVERFISAFWDRKRGGRFHKKRLDKIDERNSFEHFETPGQLAAALSSADPEMRRLAAFAMDSIVHIKSPISDWLISEAYVRSRQEDILYVYEQHSLENDFLEIKKLLSLPDNMSLPRDDVQANRLESRYNRKLDLIGEANIRALYRQDYALIDLCRALFRPPLEFSLPQ